jgi:hypothetical protein
LCFWYKQAKKNIPPEMYNMKLCIPCENYDNGRKKTLYLIIAFPTKDFWEDFSANDDWYTDERVQAAIHQKYGDSWYIDDEVEPYGPAKETEEVDLIIK